MCYYYFLLYKTPIDVWSEINFQNKKIIITNVIDPINFYNILHIHVRFFTFLFCDGCTYTRNFPLHRSAVRVRWRWTRRRTGWRTPWTLPGPPWRRALFPAVVPLYSGITNKRLIGELQKPRLKIWLGLILFVFAIIWSISRETVSLKTLLVTVNG